METKKLIVLVAIQVVLMLAAVGGTWFLTMSAIPKMEDAGAAQEEQPPAKKDPIYITLEPAFVVNLQDGRSVRYLQMEVDVMTRDEAIAERLEKYNSRIRNDLILLFSSADRESITTQEGRLMLQEQTLTTINDVLMEESGEAGVEAVYFTKFVMQ